MRNRDRRPDADHARFASAALWMWVGSGLLALLLFPALRARDPLFGWLPFWLVVAPLVDLAIVRRDLLLVATRAIRARARRRRTLPRQARRPRHHRILRAQATTAVPTFTASDGTQT